MLWNQRWDEDRDLPRLLAILTDVSDLKQAVERHTLLSRKILMTQEEERRRISRDLHDELGQILTALHLELDWIREESTSAPAEPVTFLPYLSGERTPHNNAAARGALIGMSQATEITDLARAAMVGVAYAFVDSGDILDKNGGKLQ